MSALHQPQSMFFTISNSPGFKRERNFNTPSAFRREEKKFKFTTMSASAEGRLAIAKSFVEKDIAEHKVVVYAKTWCPHCQKTKDLLGSDEFKGVNILIRNLDIMDDPSGPVLAKSLADMTGQTSVPNIFIDGKHFGGNSDIQEAHANGTLKLI